MLSPDGLYAIPFAAFHGGLTTTFNFPEPPLDFPYYDEPVFTPITNSTTQNHHQQQQEPVFSYENSNPVTKPDSNSNSGSDLSNKRKDSGSEDVSKPAESDSIVNERKRRRMVSNRDSARRSRMRKQTHLENLRSQLNRLKVTNRELINRVRVATHHCQVVGIDNDRLRSESVILQQRLWDIRQLLIVRQLQQQLTATSGWPCNNNNNNFTVPIMNYDETTITPQPLII